MRVYLGTTALIPEKAGLSTELIENEYEANKLSGVIFFDLSAAYDAINIKRLLDKGHIITNDQDLEKNPALLPLPGMLPIHQE